METVENRAVTLVRQRAGRLSENPPSIGLESYQPLPHVLVIELCLKEWYWHQQSETAGCIECGSDRIPNAFMINQQQNKPMRQKCSPTLCFVQGYIASIQQPHLCILCVSS